MWFKWNEIAMLNHHKMLKSNYRTDYDRNYENKKKIFAT